jgi:hypothetical protein
MIAGTKILKEQPTWNGVASTIINPATTETEFCYACHDLNGGDNAVANGISHYMGSATVAGSTRGTTAVASTSSSSCASCHAAPKDATTSGGASANTHVNAAKWPHDALSIAGLGAGSSMSDVTDQDHMDDHCLKCHLGTGTTVGTDY